jgi:lysophospholipase L1-like esterase
VRIRFSSNTCTLAIDLQPVDKPRLFDCVINGEVVVQATALPNETSVVFPQLPPVEKLIEVYLPHKSPVQVTGVQIEKGASFSTPLPDRLRWVTYGSSITQCTAASSPAHTWPAIVARRNQLELTCLGYSGNCHMETMVARMIRDLPADLISVCLGINVMNQSSLSPRTFRPAVIGLLSLIREKHPDVPLAVISPIVCPPRETTPNAVGLTLTQIREEIETAVKILQAHGDRRIFYVSGLDVFDEKYLDYLPDQLHPNAMGYQILADNFDQIVMQRMLAVLKE